LGPDHATIFVGVIFGAFRVFSAFGGELLEAAFWKDSPSKMALKQTGSFQGASGLKIVPKHGLEGVQIPLRKFTGKLKFEVCFCMRWYFSRCVSPWLFSLFASFSAQHGPQLGPFLVILNLFRLISGLSCFIFGLPWLLLGSISAHLGSF
jgi:hypothetical protein